ncbi:glycoside hydrolase family 30 protein [Opitutus terrae]|uniref:Glucosylceramidase n=1 Tax=Opitutus terrae (strain DSM 11246 / JCM 15787 / PB90-1) TaxID=452637 RepID=B1ZR85_OPITP|nr:glycoside hydrolase family 30 protein [Opitutus terrae]ACB74572.1 Glucosylceramidase [Opitutus terrae PB90-1]
MYSHFRSLTLLASFGGASFAFAAGVPSAQVYLTQKDAPHRLAATGALRFAPLPQPMEKQQCVFVDPTHEFETLLGIGGAITDAAAETFDKLPETKRAELLRAYYDPRAGIGYSLARTHINSCDFSSGSYTYVAEGDRELKSFDIAPDLRHRIPLLRAALKTAGPGLTVYASPWSPPAWMKDSGDMLHGGKLRPDMRAAWANYFVKFIHAYEQAGVPLWGVTVQNEPMAVQIWESCIFTAEEERDFVRDHLGPTLKASGLGGKKIVGWDHNRTQLYQRATTLLSDPAAAQYLWGLGFHWYVNDTFENVRRVRDAFPQAQLMMTEGCNGPFDFAKMNDWDLAENYGRSMIHDFNNGAVGWTDWNILLDETGGPNHVGNFCFAPVHGDTRTGELHFTPAFYYIGHFSKFIRPGARRIIASPTVDRLIATAFKNTDGSIAVVVMNQSAEDQPFHVWMNGQAASTRCPARSIMTVVIGVEQ